MKFLEPISRVCLISPFRFSGLHFFFFLFLLTRFLLVLPVLIKIDEERQVGAVCRFTSPPSRSCFWVFFRFSCVFFYFFANFCLFSLLKLVYFGFCLCGLPLLCLIRVFNFLNIWVFIRIFSFSINPCLVFLLKFCAVFAVIYHI